MAAHLTDFKDVDVIDREALDPADRLNFIRRWLVQYPGGTINTYETEGEACAVQRCWRRLHGRDPMTGEVVR